MYLSQKTIFDSLKKFILEMRGVYVLSSCVRAVIVHFLVSNNKKKPHFLFNSPWLVNSNIFPKALQYIPWFSTVYGSFFFSFLMISDHVAEDFLFLNNEQSIKVAPVIFGGHNPIFFSYLAIHNGLGNIHPSFRSFLMSLCFLTDVWMRKVGSVCHFRFYILSSRTTLSSDVVLPLKAH